MKETCEVVVKRERGKVLMTISHPGSHAETILATEEEYKFWRIVSLTYKMKAGQELRNNGNGWFLSDFNGRSTIAVSLETVAVMEDAGIIKTDVPYQSIIATLVEPEEEEETTEEYKLFWKIVSLTDKMKAGQELRNNGNGWFLSDFNGRSTIAVSLETVAVMEDAGIIKTDVPYQSIIATLVEPEEEEETTED